MDFESDLEALLEERISAVHELEDDHGEFMQVARELRDNLEAYDRQNTLKHGTAVENLKSISEEGLRPGDENDSVAGERSDQKWVRMTHLFPAAVKYGEEAFPERQKVVSKANDWAEFLGKNIADWSPQIDLNNEQARNVVMDPAEEPEGHLYGGLYTHLVNAVEKLEFVEANEVDTDPVVIEMPYGSAGHVHVPWGKQHPDELEEHRKEIEIDGVGQPHYMGEKVLEYGLLGKTEDELEAINEGKLGPSDPLQETKITFAEMDEKAAVYVPQERLEELRERYSDRDFSVLSIEAKNLQHELRMNKKYEEHGTVNYRTPWDIDGHVIDFDWDEGEYDRSPQAIDISG